MRKIKFRAWHKQNKEMVYFDHDKLVNDIFVAQHFVCLMRGDYGDVLMQFTGLKDVNGVDIYEGDIIQAGNDRFKSTVIFFRDGWRSDIDIKRTLTEFNHARAIAMKVDGISVIGNIHENHELIAEGDL